MKPAALPSEGEKPEADSDAPSAAEPATNAQADNISHALSTLQQHNAAFSAQAAATAAFLTSAANANTNANIAAQLQASMNPALVTFLQGALSAQLNLSNTAQLVQMGVHPALAAQLPLGAWNLQHHLSDLNNAAIARDNQAMFGGMALPQVNMDPNLAIYQFLMQQAMTGGNAIQSELAQLQGSVANQANLSDAVSAAPYAASTQAALVAQQQIDTLRISLLNDIHRREDQDKTDAQHDSSEPPPAAALAQGPLHRKPELNETSSSSGARNSSARASQDSASDAAATTLMYMQRKRPAPLALREFPFEGIVAGSVFTKLEHRGLVADSFFASIAQMKACGLIDDDRVGKYKHRKLGFAGMCCKHCGGHPGFGRYFPGSFDSFLNGKHCDGIVKHIASECRRCPMDVRELVVELERREALAGRQARPRYGSRKRFFAYVWEQLQSVKLEDQSPPQSEGTDRAYSSEQNDKVRVSESSSTSANRSGEVGSSTYTSSTAPTETFWDLVLKDSQIVSMNDRHLVPDTLMAALAQMRPCQVTADDRIGRCKNHQIGFVGMCCKHCGGKAGKPGYGRYFPSSIRSLAQVDSCQHIVKHVASTCQQCPPEIRSTVLRLQQLENTERIRYGSRKMFFRRVWARLHEDDAPTKVSAKSEASDDSSDDDTDAADKKVAAAETHEEINWDELVAGGALVTREDQGLISPAQFAAMAQMKACRLTESDKTGWYKDREVGFGGFCCKHCGGRPSFGRYFPKTVGSFAQTTSSHTIIRHITSYCTDCPELIRVTVLRLQQEEQALQREVGPGNSAYGSRKIFYDRVWARLHGDDANFDEDASVEGLEEEADVPLGVFCAAAPDDGDDKGLHSTAAVGGLKRGLPGESEVTNLVEGWSLTNSIHKRDAPPSQDSTRKRQKALGSEPAEARFSADGDLQPL